MTINMLLRPPFINYNGDDYKNERLELLINHVLPHYDIVALQEVFWFWNSRLSKLIKAAQALGFHWYTNNASPPMFSKYDCSVHDCWTRRLTLSPEGKALTVAC